MKDINKFHRSAMDFADRAFIAKQEGKQRSFITLSRKAFHAEKKAAELCKGQYAIEPTRSILHRSAAALAIDCGELREAERLIAMALAGEPPQQIAEELRDLLEQTYFRRHLELKGQELSSAELQFSISGSSVGFGFTEKSEFIKRIDAFSRLISRTVDRKLSRPFDERRQEKTSDAFGIYLSTPRAASFAVTLQVAQPSQLDMFPSIKDGGVIIDEIMECFDLFAKSEFAELKHRMPEPYFNNFIGLARSIEPDGQQVKIVGLTSVHAGALKTVSLTKQSSARFPTFETELSPSPESLGQYEDGDTVTVRGVLLAADSTSARKSKIIVKDTGTDKEYGFSVPKGMMADIVRPLYECDVTAVGKVKGKSIMLQDIRKGD